MKKLSLFLAACFLTLAVSLTAAADEAKPQETKKDPAMQIEELLGKAGAFYLATVEGDQPRVRPFGTALLYDGRLYIQTGKVKSVSKQIAADPKVELCAFNGKKWLRLSGELVNDDDRAVKAAMLDKMPELKGMYSADDDNTQVLYFKNATAVFCSFGEAPEMIRF